MSSETPPTPEKDGQAIAFLEADVVRKVIAHLQKFCGIGSNIETRKLWIRCVTTKMLPYIQNAELRNQLETTLRFVQIFLEFDEEMDALPIAV